MSVVGFDLGFQSCFIAVARQGGIETIANEYSDRNTPAFVSYSDKNRQMGAAAKQQIMSNMKNTVWGWKKLIGRQYSDPVVQHEKNLLPYNLVEMPGGGVGIQVQYINETQVFTPQQITTSMLTKLKSIAEINLKTKVCDCVLSVPCYFTDIERRALMDATKMAGLNCLKLLNDTTATALAYGIYKQDLPAPEEKARNVVFVDFGCSDLQVSAAAFNKGKLKVLATSSHPCLGGRDLDKLITDNFAHAFIEKYKIDVRTKAKAYVRLTQECENIKKKMSSNITEIPLNIECLMDDKDVSGRMGRAEMVEMAASIFTEARQTMADILTLAGLKTDDIYSVEIVGGSTRIPIIKDIVKEVFGKDASTTLNQDEAVARGCALQCAILSPTLRVRDFSITDCQPYPITLAWQASMNDAESDMEVYTRFHQVPFSKMLTFYRKEPFKLEARYSAAANTPHPTTSIGSFGIDKIVPQADGTSSKVKVKVRVNIHGIFTVSSASMVEKQESVEEEKMDEDKKEDEKKPESMEVESNGPVEGSGDVNGTPEPTPASPEPAPPAKEGSQEPMDTEAKTEPATTEAESKEDKKETKNKKIKVKTIDLPITENVNQLSQDQINQLYEKECQMNSQDRLENDRKDAKNTIEEYVYEMRDKLYTDLETYVTEDDRSALTLQLEDTENWLYEDGEDETKAKYSERLQSLKDLGQPIVDRFREASWRPAAFQELGQALQLISKAVEQYKNKEDKYAHIEEAEMEKVEKCLSEKREWFDRYMNQCSAIKPHENPPTHAVTIRTTKQSLESTCHPILNKPKPKPKVEEPPKDEPAKPTTEPAADKTEAGDESKKDGTPTDPSTAESSQAPPPAAPEKSDMELD